MFEQIENKSERWRPSRRVAVWGAVFFAFILGALSGILARQLVVGRIPDWTLLGPQLALPLFFMVWLAMSATRKDS
jgi:hypothetical protein